MAEEKKDAPKKDGNWFIMYLPFIVIGVLLIIGSKLDNETIFGTPLSDPRIQQPQEIKRDALDIYGWLGKDRLTLGERIINTEKAVIRTAPAGSIVGNQKKLETGRLMEGPVNQFNTLWWRVDYPTAPDGWVEFYSISSKIKTVRMINIVPLAYGFYRPIGYSLLILLLVFFAFYKIKLSKEEKISEKRLQLRQEQYREPQKPLAELIAEKPDVQEISGFQTEEIVPIKIAEKNNRWIHIQDLIKSYNVNDWKQAIIEADIILEEMLEKMQYDGVTIGDKLKNVERSDFITLDRAWSAHRVRNQIAHDGSAFKLSRELAENTIKDFEAVFKEFYYI